MSGEGLTVRFLRGRLRRQQQQLAEDGYTTAGGLPVVDLDAWSWQDTLVVVFVIAALADVTPEAALAALEDVARGEAVEPYGVQDWVRDCLAALAVARAARCP